MGRGWTAMSSHGAPSGHEAPVAAAVGRFVLALWGATAEAPQERGAWYELDTDRWWPLTAMPALAPRAGAAIAWTGDELLIWGGARAGKRHHRAWFGDGARLGGDGQWRRMASADGPSPRVPHAAWTGDELVIWGGAAKRALSGGAAYRPDDDTWRSLSAQAEPAARGHAYAAWSGSELCVWGGVDEHAPGFRGEPLRDGAAYDPRADAWRALAPLPGPIAASAVAPGGALVVASAGAALWRYDGAADRWRSERGPSASAIGQVRAIVHAGDELVVIGSDACACRAAGGGWAKLPPRPVGLDGATLVALADELIFVGGGAPGGWRLRLRESTVAPDAAAAAEPPLMVTAARAAPAMD